MEPLTLATMAVNFVTPYLARAGEAIAKKASEIAWENGCFRHNRRSRSTCWARREIKRFVSSRQPSLQQASYLKKSPTILTIRPIWRILRQV